MSLRSRGSPVLLSLGPMRLTTAKRVPSGDQRNTLTPFFKLVIRLASPPFIESKYTCVRDCSVEAVFAPGPGVLSGREERKAIDLPSGLQRGEFDDCGEVVNCHGARLPSVLAIQIEELRRFCARSILETT